MYSHEGCEPQHPMIAIVGFSARAAAQCAARDGLGVIAVDMCADRDLIPECEMHLRLNDANWPNILNAKYPAVPMLFTGGMEHRSSSIDQCHRVAKRFGATGEQVRAMRNLDSWAEWARGAGIAWPITVRDAHQSSSMLAKDPRRRWLLKSLHSAGGTGTIDVTATLSLGDSIPLEQENRYIQERLPGESIGVTFLSSEFGCAVVGAALACPSDTPSRTKEFRYDGSVGPIPLSNLQYCQLQRFAECVWRKTELRGLWQADFLLHEDTWTLLEVNPRWSASMDLLDYAKDYAKDNAIAPSTGLGLVRSHCDAICCSLSKSTFEQFSHTGWNLSDATIPSESNTMLGKRIVYADDTIRISQAQSDSWWSRRWHREVLADEGDCFFADIPEANTTVESGGPLLTVMSKGNSVESILKALRHASIFDSGS